MPMLNLADIHLYYEVTGNGLPLLLIHGLGSSSRDWEKQVEPFAKEYQVITLILVGKRSAGPSPLLSPKQLEAETTRPARLPFEKFAFVNSFNG